MGSKNLKAIAVRGTGRVPIAEPEAFQRVAGEWQARLESQPAGTSARELHMGGLPPADGERRPLHPLPFPNPTTREGAGASLLYPFDGDTKSSSDFCVGEIRVEPEPEDFSCAFGECVDGTSH